MKLKLRYIATPFILLSTLYILYITSGVPMVDEWRWIQDLLIPLELGEITFFEYMNGEYAFLAHSHYLTLLCLYLDYTFLHLDLAYLAYVGVFFYVLGFVAITLYVKAHPNPDARVNFVSYLAIAVAYFCLSCDFPWLLVTFEYVYFFMAIILMLAVNAHVYGDLSRAKLLVLLVVCLVLGDTIGMTAVFTSSLVLVCLSFYNQRIIKSTLAVAFAVAATLTLQYVFLGKGVGSGSHSRIETILEILHNPLDAVISFASIFCQPLLDINFIKYIVGTESAPQVQFVVGLFGLICVLITFFFWFRQDGLNKSITPLLFTGFGLLSWAFIFTSRYLDAGVSAMDETRYVRFFTLIYLGCGIALMQMRHTVQSKCFLYIATTLLAVSFFLMLSFKLLIVDSVKGYFKEARIEIMRSPVNSDELGKLLWRCNNNYCNETIDFLRANNLSVFYEPNEIDKKPPEVHD